MGNGNITNIKFFKILMFLLRKKAKLGCGSRIITMDYGGEIFY